MKKSKWVVLSVLVLGACGISSRSYAMAPAQPSESAQQISQVYGVNVIRGENLSAAEFDRAARILKEHLDREYTPSFIRQTKLQEIVLHRQTIQNGSIVGGYTQGNHMEVSVGSAGATEVEDPDVLKNCEGARPGTTEALNCQALHAAESGNFIYTFNHELFHVIDIAALEAWQDTSHWSQEWAALNPRGFSYVGSGWTFISQGRSESHIQARSKGFVSAYSTSSVLEDRAEVFGNAMRNPDEFRRVMRTDRIVARKFKIIVSMLRELCASGACALPKNIRALAR